jgi:hypothetical protein
MFRRMMPFCLWLFTILPAAQGLDAAGAQPAYVQLVLRLDDHLNFEMTMDRLERTLSQVEALRARYPGLEPVCLVELNGVGSAWLDGLRQGSPVVGKLFRMIEEGAVEIGYHGYNEPVELKWPQFDFRRAKSPAQRWDVRTRALELFLSEYKAPVSGEPDPDRAGGLKRTLEVFPRVVMVSGVERELGGDPELAALLRRWRVSAALAGVPEITHFIARNLNGFRTAMGGFATLMSPEPDHAPQLYWQDGFLHLSDAAAIDQGLLQSSDGIETIRKRLASLPRAHPQVLRLVLSPPVFHLKPEVGREVLDNPARWAMANPKAAAVASELYLSRADVDAHYARQRQTLDFLCDEWMGANPPSRFVSVAALLRAAGDGYGDPLSKQAVREAATDLLQRWGSNNHVPSYAKAAGRYLSLSDLVDLFSAALTVSSPHYPLRRAAGLDELPVDQGPAGGAVSRQDVLSAAKAISDRLNLPLDQQPSGERLLPGFVPVGGRSLNAAQFLYLMAELIAEPRDSLNIRTCQALHAPGMILPTSRPEPDRGTVWTLKPASLRLGSRVSLPADGSPQ